MDSRIQYSVDYENGVVLAWFNPDEIMSDLIEETIHLADKMQNSTLRWGVVFEQFEKFRKQNKTTLDNLCGKAKCNMDAGDKFDVETGEELAKRRLLVKVASLRTRWFWQLEFIMTDDIFRFMDRYSHHQRIANDYDEELINYAQFGKFDPYIELKF